MQLNKFVPLTKMEEQSDGTLHVFGTVTAELPDLENEVCDYEGTKPLYEKRAAEQLEKTSLPGMTPSMMPFREMHNTKVQGAGRSLVCDDATKTIKMGFHVVTEEAVKMWKAGCFVGFSQGGSYVKQWPDPEFDGCTRYIADPMEVSAVDSPCLPSALVESMKGRTVTLAKAGGTTEEVPLQVNIDRMDRIEKSLDRLLGFMVAEKTVNAIIPTETASTEIAAAGGSKENDVKISTQEDLTKAAKSIHDHLENLKAAHDKMGEQHEKVGEHIEKCMKACSDAIGGEEPKEKAAPEGDLAKVAADKAVADKMAALEASVASLTELVKTKPATVPPNSGADPAEFGGKEIKKVAPDFASLLN